MDASLVLALRHLRRTPAKDLAKAAVKDLVRRDVLRLLPFEDSGWRRTRTRPGLADGPTALAGGALLLAVAQVVRATPQVTSDGRLVHDVRVVAKRLSGRGRQLQEAALRDLEAAGLVVGEPGKVLGLFSRTTWRRTAAGDDALRRGGRRPGDGGSEAGVVVAGDDGRRVDESFDASFDSSFDSSFDASFDSGFSSGDGGGGDGGGGGGD